MSTFKLTLAYEGTEFVGWQRQATGRSVQGVVEDALSHLEGARVAVVGASRTDAGVHALGQVAGVRLTRSPETDVLRRALNAHLPADVRVLAVEPAPEGFHARHLARSKTYRYRLACGPVLGPLDRRIVWHLPGPLDVPEMERAARAFEGRHDFAAFQSVGSDARTTIRHVVGSALASTAREGETEQLAYEVTGDGFLRHMVRAMVGTLVEVGTGRLRADDVPEILASRDRQRAGATAPAWGLCLVSVAY